MVFRFVLRNKGFLAPSPLVGEGRGEGESRSDTSPA